MVVLLKPVFKSLFELVITNHHEPVYFNISHQESIAVSIKKQGKVSKEQHQVFLFRAVILRRSYLPLRKPLVESEGEEYYPVMVRSKYNEHHCFLCDIKPLANILSKRPTTLSYQIW